MNFPLSLQQRFVLIGNSRAKFFHIAGDIIIPVSGQSPQISQL